jgi:hypothetical protein
MFVLSQIALNKSKACRTSSIPSYSIAMGLVVYASVYLYLLFYHNDYISIFNKFVIYIIGIDLLLSAFFYYNSQYEYMTNPHLDFSQDFIDADNMCIINHDDIDNESTDDGLSDKNADDDIESFGEDYSDIDDFDDQDDDISLLQASVHDDAADEDVVAEESHVVQQTEVEASSVTDIKDECADAQTGNRTVVHEEAPKRKRGRPKNQTKTDT